MTIKKTPSIIRLKKLYLDDYTIEKSYTSKMILKRFYTQKKNYQEDCNLKLFSSTLFKVNYMLELLSTERLNLE